MYDTEQVMTVFTVLKKHIKKCSEDSSVEQVQATLSIGACSICPFEDNLFPITWNNWCPEVLVQSKTRSTDVK